MKSSNIKTKHQHHCGIQSIQQPGLGFFSAQIRLVFNSGRLSLSGLLCSKAWWQAIQFLAPSRWQLPILLERNCFKTGIKVNEFHDLWTNLHKPVTLIQGWNGWHDLNRPRKFGLSGHCLVNHHLLSLTLGYHLAYMIMPHSHLGSLPLVWLPISSA